MPDYNASAECRAWSPKAPQTFQGLCSMIMSAETGNPSTDCEICVEPVFVPYVEPPPDPCSGTSVWLWVPGPNRWDLWEDNCVGEGCVPTPPTSPGTTTNPEDPPEYGNGGCELAIE